MKPYLKINQLILIGTRKDYKISFYQGVNIIYGDSDSGKSSILEFINYLLGSSSLDLADEITSSVEYAALEVDINGVTFTVKRDIYKNKELIDVYRCGYYDCGNHFPKKYSPNYNITTAPDGYFSEFLLDSLNFPKIKIKVSPTKPNSNMKRISFRNIYKYVYVNQDDIGSKSFLNLGDWSKYTSNKEVFKYIFNVLDESISELNEEILEKNVTLSKYRNKYAVISEFLRETDYESIASIDNSINEVDLFIEKLNESLKEINNSMTASSDQYKELKALFNLFSLKEKEADAKILSIKDKIDKYSRLKNDYDNDIAKIKAIHVANSRIGGLNEDVFSCPVCDSHIKIEDNITSFEVSTESELDEEFSSLTKRRKNINELINSLSEEYKITSRNKKTYESDIIKARELIDFESQSMITPYLTQRDGLVTEISRQKKSREYLVNNLKVRNQQEELLKNKMI